MGIRERLSGNEATAIAMRQINPDVVAAFPITPSTGKFLNISRHMSLTGLVDTEFVAVESEHSAMSACIGAQAAGARAMTATSGKRFGIYVGGFVYSGKYETSDCIGGCKQSTFRSYQYPQRPQRYNGS